MKIELINPKRAESLIRELDVYQNKLYPVDSCHLDSIETLQSENVYFYGAIENNEVVAIGSVKLFQDYGELKRIYVPISQRRKGLAKKIMEKLESLLISKNIFLSRLETGPYSKDAISLYEKLGYSTCNRFGSYKEDPLSTFMEKKLYENKPKDNELVKYISRYTTLTEEETKAVIEEIPIRTFKKGTILLKEGEIAAECYFNIKGLVRQYYIVDGEEKTTFFYTEEYAISGIPEKPSKYYLVCDEDCTLTIGKFDAEEDFFKRFPKFESLCRVLSSEYFETYEDLLATYILKSPEDRYLSLLKERPDLKERVPQYQLANYLGITPESLSRIRKRILFK